MYYGLRSPERPWSCHSSAHLGAPRNNEDYGLRPAVTRAPRVMPFLSSSVIWAPLCKLSYNKGAPPPPRCLCITACGHQGAPGHAIPQLIWASLCQLSYNKGAPPSPGCPSVFQVQGCITACGHQGAPGHVFLRWVHIMMTMMLTMLACFIQAINVKLQKKTPVCEHMAGYTCTCELFPFNRKGHFQ